MPVEGIHLWGWYFDINDMMGARVVDGLCRSIPPSEFLAWAEMTGTIVYSHEYDILAAMDRSYCKEYNKELQDYRARQKEEFNRKVAEAEAKSGANRGR